MSNIDWMQPGRTAVQSGAIDARQGTRRGLAVVSPAPGSSGRRGGRPHL